MVSVNGQVQTHELDEVLVLSEAKLVGEVEGIVLVFLDWCHLSVLENVLVDTGSDGRELGNDVHSILESVLPVLLLVHALGVGLGKGGLVLKCVDSDGELSHWVEIAWAAVNELLDEFWDIGTCGPVGGQIANLLL